MANSLNYTLNLKDLFSKGMSNAINQTGKLDNKMSNLQNSQSKLTTGIGKLGGMIAGAFSIGAITSFGSAVIDSLDNYQKFHASLNTMLHGNENATKALEGQLVNLAKTTPFQLTEVQDATKQLLAYGFKAGDVVDTMKTLGDVSAGVGAPLQDIAYLYGTLKTSGRVMTVDLRQFAGRGIPIYETLAKRLGVATSKINEMVTAGKIGFKDIEGAFKDMTSQGGQFFNLMEDQSKTVGGKISNLGDSWEQLKVGIGKSQSGIIAGTVEFFNTMLSGLSDYYAQQNRITESAKKYGGKGDSLIDTARNFLGLGSGLGGKMSFRQQYDEEIQKIQQSKISDASKLLKLNQEIVRISNLKKENKLSTEDYQTQIGLLKTGIDTIKGNIDLKNQTAKTSDLAAAKESTAKETKLGTGTEVTGARPQNLTININELVHELKLMSTNVQEGAMKIKEEIAKALMEAVNDVNLVAR